jgi:Leucine-rich repeat (LRR) protein
MLQDLEELDLSSNGIKQVPKLVFDLPKLIKLNLSFNDFHELPVEIAKLTGLAHLNLYYGALKEFPAILEKMPQLEVLELGAKDGSHSWNHFPMGLLRLPKLKVLKLQFHRLTEIPEGLVNLPLETLDLENNRLTHIPDWLFKAKGLRSLSLKGNEAIPELPAGIGDLVHLERLAIGGTKINALPPSVANLQQLKELDLSKLKFEDNVATMVILKQLPLVQKINYQNGPDQEFRSKLEKAFPKARII